MSTSKFLKIKVYLLNLIAQGYMKMGNSLMLASLENHIFLKTTETNQKMGNRIRHAVLCKNQTSFCVTYSELGSVHMWDETVGLPPCNAGKY